MEDLLIWYDLEYWHFNFKSRFKRPLYNFLRSAMCPFSSCDLIHNHHDQITVFGILTFNWFLLYFIVHHTFTSTKLNPKLTLDTKNRIVSIIHGILSFIFAAYEFIGGDFEIPNSQFQNFICIFSLSYSLYDLVACQYYGLADMGLYIHHVFCLIGFGSPLYYEYGALIALGGLFVSEISNFPMHLRVVIRNYGLKFTRIYELCQNIYLAFYIIFRGIVCPIYLFVPGMMATNSPAITMFVCFGMTIQNFYYIFQMKNIIKRKLKNYKEMDEKKVKYFWFEENKQISQLSFYKAKGPQHIF